MRWCLHVGGCRSPPLWGCSDRKWALPEARPCCGWPKMSPLLGGQLCQKDIKGTRKKGTVPKLAGFLTCYHLQGQAISQPRDCFSTLAVPRALCQGHPAAPELVALS